ncbi:uncharacterized protein LOC143290337 [Babylonia areolata]|uniref:uncharacterized protein LOC143290337 n=1 Tax=Babylonia areolata TaxID=304850 RepID=UPI003FCF174E
MGRGPPDGDTVTCCRRPLFSGPGEAERWWPSDLHGFCCLPYNQVVLIHPDTRRPTPLPGWWRDHYGPLGVRQQGVVVAPRCPPDTVDTDLQQHAHRLRVVWTDTDTNDHTNNISYVRFAVDALVPAVREGTLASCLTLEDLRSGVSEVKAVYQRESSEGDELHVHLWCPLAEERTVVCSMEKQGGQPVCQVTLRFHDEGNEEGFPAGEIFDNSNVEQRFDSQAKQIRS